MSVHRMRKGDPIVIELGAEPRFGEGTPEWACRIIRWVWSTARAEIHQLVNVEGTALRRAGLVAALGYDGTRAVSVEDLRDRVRQSFVAVDQGRAVYSWPPDGALWCLVTGESGVMLVPVFVTGETPRG